MARSLLASIKVLGLHPCVRCLVVKDHIHRLGMTRDMSDRISVKKVRSRDPQVSANMKDARKLINNMRTRFEDKRITLLLGQWSLAPIEVSTIEIITGSKSSSLLLECF